MAYVKINYQDKPSTATPLNAANLNKMDSQIKTNSDNLDALIPKVNTNIINIEKNKDDIAALTSGETPMGAWTPTSGAEYPSSAIPGQSWYISDVANAGYTFASGNLSGELTHNQDKIIFTQNGWSLIKNDLINSIPAGAIGRLTSPLLDLPLKNSLAMKAGVGSVTFTRATTATYIDRYGVLQTAQIDEPRFNKKGLLVEGFSTNYFIDSNVFDGLSSSRGVTVTPNFGISPSGILNSSNVVVDNIEANPQIGKTISGMSNGFMTGSFWVKFKVMNNEVRMTVGDNSMVDVTNQIVLNKWVRIFATANSTDSLVRLYLNVSTLDEFEIAFAQIEQLSLMSSYVPTV